MHDLKFARQIISVLEETLKKECPSKPVTLATVHVSLSPFSHVSAQRLKEIFELLIEGEKLPLVELVVKAMEIEIFCRRCLRHSRIKEPAVICPHCKIEDIQICVKEELVIDAIEIETNTPLLNERAP